LNRRRIGVVSVRPLGIEAKRLTAGKDAKSIVSTGGKGKGDDGDGIADVKGHNKSPERGRDRGSGR
jgi:hypothetical protein